MQSVQVSLIIKSYPERLVGRSLPYWLTLLLVWQGIFAADYIMGLSIPEAHEHLPEFACLILFFAFVCITIVYCSRVLSKLLGELTMFIDVDEKVLRDWYEKQLRRSYSGFWPVLFGIAFVIVENFTVGSTIRQFSPAGTSVYYFRVAYELVGFFFLGMGLWTLVNVLYIPIGLTRYKIRVSLNQLSGRGLQALGTSYFRMSLAIAFTFMPIVVAAIISPLMDDISVLLWLAAGASAIFGFFLLPQVGIHRIMAQEKNQRLLKFSHHLEEAMERSLNEPTSENMQRLKELFDLQGHLKNMNDWPFNVQTLWQLITALLIPLGLAILEIFF